MAVPGSQNTPAAAPTASRAPVQWAAIAMGSVFLVVGILGFVPGITTDYDTQSFAGRDSGAMLFGLFNVSVLHNLVHLLFGVLGLAMAATFNAARVYLAGGGAVYTLLWIYGLVVDRDAAANVVPLNTADNWLHLALAVGMLLLAAVLGRTGEVPRLPARH